MILLLSILFYFLSQKKGRSLWLVLPVSLLLDIWKLENLGRNGIFIMIFVGAAWFVFGTKVRESYKLKV